MTSLTGNADRFLAAGIHGYQWANVGEIMRTYPGWAPAEDAPGRDHDLQAVPVGSHPLV
jgi:hypothetical protein